MSAPQPPDRIEVRGLRIVATHGVLPEERDRAQPFELDLDVSTDTGPAGASDRLADTVDYGALVERVAELVRATSFLLLEALAGAVAQAVLDFDPRIEEVAVVVRKLRPPIAQDISSVGVRVVRGRREEGPPEIVTDAPTRRAFVGLGSNLGDRRGSIERAVALLAATGDVVAVSPLYETDPVGGPDGQDQYLNAVVELSTADSPRALLARCQQLEEDAGRVRTVRFGPRSLDADVLLVGSERVHEPDLEVPHPRMGERRFVLAPLADLAPDLVSADDLDAAVGAVVRVGTLSTFTTSVTKSDH